MVARRVPRWSELAPLIRPRRLPGDAVDRRLAKAADVRDIRAIARRQVPRAVFDYTDGAAGEELSLARSREAFRRVEFRPSVLRDVSAVDLSTTILGTPSALPLVFAPTGFTRLMNSEGEPAVARVAERVGIPHALSTMGTTSMEALAAAAPQVRRWFQLYLWRDREASAAMVQRAREAGYEALVLTVDTPVAGAAAARRPQRVLHPAGADPAHRRQRRAAPPVVVRPAHHRAAGVRLAQLVGRHHRRARRQGVRAGRHDRRRPAAAGGLAGQAGRQGHPDRRGRPRGGGRRGRRRRRLQPRRPAARPGADPAGGAAVGGGGRRRPRRGLPGRRHPRRCRRRRRGGVRAPAPASSAGRTSTA